jgi:broad specificity phosphatase PhoE
MSCRLYLLRHGVTESNRNGRYMGRSHEPLSGDGRWQARQLALRLAQVDLSAVYSSPLRRAQETAEIVAGAHRLPVETEPGFIELDLSRWAGLSAAEIEAKDPEAWHTWCDDPSRLALAGIEPFEDLANRVKGAVDGLRRRHPNHSIAVVTHDGVVRMAVLQAMGLALTHYRSIPVDNTSITILELGGVRPYLRALNDIGHLTDSARALGSGRGPADR